jgi:hypothetical protein
MHRGGSNPSWCFAFLENNLVDFVCSKWIIRSSYQIDLRQIRYYHKPLIVVTELCCPLGGFGMGGPWFLQKYLAKRITTRRLDQDKRRTRTQRNSSRVDRDKERTILAGFTQSGSRQGYKSFQLPLFLLLNLEPKFRRIISNDPGFHGFLAISLQQSVISIPDLLKVHRQVHHGVQVSSSS